MELVVFWKYFVGELKGHKPWQWSWGWERMSRLGEGAERGETELCSQSIAERAVLIIQVLPYAYFFLI